MKRIRSNDECRHCSRCRKELTDPLSWARGTGKDCAGKDAILFARTIPANYGMISATLYQIAPSSLPVEVQEKFEKMRERLLNKAAKAISAASTQDIIDLNVTGQTLAEEVRTIDYILSFEVPEQTRHMLADTVKYMGFSALASVMKGEASTGEAEVVFKEDSGMLALTGSKTKQGWIAARKIRGVRMPYSNERTIRVPAKAHNELKTLVYEFWPIISDTKLDTAIDAAKVWLEKRSASIQTTPEPEITEKTCLVKKRSADFIVKFGWIPNVTEKVVEEIKTIDWKCRKYNGFDKTWYFTLEHLDTVKNIVGKYYDVVEQETNEDTNISYGATVSKHKSYGYYRRS